MSAARLVFQCGWRGGGDFQPGRFRMCHGFGDRRVAIETFRGRIDQSRLSPAASSVRHLHDGHGCGAVYETTRDKIDAPLNVLGAPGHVPALQIPLSRRGDDSFFALCLSCINAGDG